MAGRTFDNSITGVSTIHSIPYIAIQSILEGGKIYWAKALSLKRG
jgi:hypothetical protein